MTAMSIPVPNLTGGAALGGSTAPTYFGNVTQSKSNTILAIGVLIILGAALWIQNRK